MEDLYRQIVSEFTNNNNELRVSMISHSQIYIARSINSFIVLTNMHSIVADHIAIYPYMDDHKVPIIVNKESFLSVLKYLEIDYNLFIDILRRREQIFVT